MRASDGCTRGFHCHFAHLSDAASSAAWQCPMCLEVNRGNPPVCGRAHCGVERPDDMAPCGRCRTLKFDEDVRCVTCQFAGEEEEGSGSDDSDNDFESVAGSYVSSSDDESDAVAQSRPLNPPAIPDWLLDDVDVVGELPASPITHGHFPNTTKRGPFSHLPILQAKAQIVDCLKAERLLICKAETGSGKTTQLPQYFADDHSFPGAIICTQPRQIAAMDIAKRVAAEYDHMVALPGDNGRSVPPLANTKSRHLVSFLGGNQTSRLNRINFMTEETLIRLCSSNPTLDGVSVLIIDEAHERNLNTDIVLGIAKQALVLRRDFHVVVASATIDETKFLAHFGVSSRNVMSVKGRTFPVTVEEVSLPTRPKALMPPVESIVDYLIKKMKSTERHTLVFCSGQRDIETGVNVFMKHPMRAPGWVALPLYGSLPPEERQRAMDFDDHPSNATKRMVVFCTNIAETSLTLPGVRLVLDTGVENLARFDRDRRLNVLELSRISQSSADQRKGRAGRVAEGHCVRFFPYADCQPTNVAEITRSSLDAVCLRICSLPNQSISQFPFIEHPGGAAVRASCEQLLSMGCITPTYTITPKGTAFFNLPFDPRWSEFIYTAYCYDADLVEEATIIAAVQCAPGSLFFYGKDKDDKATRRQLIGDLCKGHVGDLRFTSSIYRGWSTAGAGGASAVTCSTCKMQRSRGACRCQKTFAADHSLNQRVLESIRSTVRDALSTWRGRRIERPDALIARYASLGQHDWIGKALLKSFPEQIAYVPIPEQVAAGLVSADGALAQISTASVFNNNPMRTSIQMVFAAKTTVVGDMRICDGLEVLAPAWSREMGVIVKPFPPNFVCVHKQFLGPMFEAMRFAPELRGKTVFGHTSGGEYQWWAGESSKDAVRDLIIKTRAKMEASHQAYPFSMHEGRVKVVLKSGLELADMVLAQNTFRLSIDVTDLLESPSAGDSTGNARHASKPKANIQTLLAKLGVDSKNLSTKPILRDTSLKLEFTSASSAKSLLAKHTSRIVIDAGEADTRREARLHIFQTLVADGTEFGDLKLRLVGAGLEVKVILSAAFALVRGKFDITLLNQGDLTSRPNVDAKTEMTFISVKPEKLELYLSDGWKLNKKGGSTSGKLSVIVKTDEDERRLLSVLATCPNVKCHDANCRLLLPSTVSEGKASSEWSAIAPHLASAKFRRVEKFMSIALCGSEINASAMTFRAAANALQGRHEPKKLPLSGLAGLACIHAMKSDPARCADLIAAGVSINLPDADRWFARSSYTVSLSGDMSAVLKMVTRLWDMHALYSNGATSKLYSMSIPLSKFFFKRDRPELQQCPNIVWNNSGVLVFGDTPQAFQHADALFQSATSRVMANCILCAWCAAPASSALQRCGHGACRGCIANAVGRRQFPIQCPHRNCGALIGASDVEDRSLLEGLALAQIGTVGHRRAPAAVQLCAKCRAGVVDATQPFASCSACDTPQCTSCGFDTTVHAGFTCGQVRDVHDPSRQQDILMGLFDAAAQFIKDTVRDRTIVRVEKNPCAMASCSARSAFQKGSQLLMTTKGIFGWHGTMSHDAIRSICHGGLDVGRRAGQAHGPGEYFGIEMGNSDYYARMTNTQILFYLLQSPNLKTVPNFCHVVKNDSNDVMFCVPLLVVQYTKTAGGCNASEPAAILSPPCPHSLPAKAPSVSVLDRFKRSSAMAQPKVQVDGVKLGLAMCPFRFEWWDDTEYVVYPDAVNLTLNQAYGQARTCTINACRYLDDVHADYTVDFGRMVQINAKTGYERRVRRVVADNAANSPCVFSFLNGSSDWQPYDSSDQITIGRAFSQYLVGEGAGVVKLRLTGRPEMYTLNFTSGTQTNDVTGAVRLFRREKR